MKLTQPLPPTKWGDATRTILIALFAGVIPTAIVSLVTAWSAREDKRLDWARQDAVAARVAEVASAVRTTDGKLDQIHTLVNSAFTAQMQSEHDAYAALLVELRKNKGEAGQIAPVEAKLAVLRVALDERKRTAALLEAKGK